MQVYAFSENVGFRLILYLLLFAAAIYGGKYWDTLKDKSRPKRQQSDFLDTLQSAEQGEAEAQYNVGLMYDYGQGVAENDAECMKWFRKAAEQGHAEAQFRLGLIYAGIDVARGTSQNENTAAEWYRKAALQGYPEAQFFLGHAYESGEGVPKDQATAEEWYGKAALQGLTYDRKRELALARTFLQARNEKYLNNGSEAVPGAFTPAKPAGQQRDKAKKKKKKSYAFGCLWLPLAMAVMAITAFNLRNFMDNREFAKTEQAAKQGDVQAQYHLGTLYDAGWGVKGWGAEPDAFNAAWWIQKAAEQGNARAQLYLGAMYDRGRGVPKSRADAVKWLRWTAVKWGSDGDAAEAAQWFLDAIKQEPDGGNVLGWLYSCAKWGDVEMQTRLGLFYLKGLAVPENTSEAENWFRKAAEQGYGEAQYQLGVMYATKRIPMKRGGLYYSETRRQYYLKGVEWLGKAAKQGHAGARFQLGLMYFNGQGVFQNGQKACALWRDAAQQGNEQAIAARKEHCYQGP